MVPRDVSRRKFLSAALGAAVMLPAVSCGTLLYPERRGQPPGRLDPAVIVMNGLLLLLFVVPGVVAFVVDFATGAIYLPPSGYYYGQAAPVEFDPHTWQRVDVDKRDLTPARVEQVVLQHTGKRVRLDEDAFDVHALDADGAAPAFRGL